MTIIYSSEIATNLPHAFLKLLFRWKGSVYRYIWCEFILFICIYGLLSLTYRLLMPEVLKRGFEILCIQCHEIGDLIPLGFVLGFYVDSVVTRWWEQFISIPWPDQLAMLLSAYTHGSSKKIHAQLKAIMRYTNLSFILATRNMSSRARARYPTEQHLIAAGLFTPEELKAHHFNAPMRASAHYSQPLSWAIEVVKQMRAEGSIESDRAVELLTVEIINFRGGLGMLMGYDWVNIPLVYSQVATLTVYIYCISALFAWQFLDPKQNYVGHNIDLYFPVFGMLRFVFYMGWLKVAESLINPFGDDLDDFEVEEIIERNLQFSNFVVGEMYDEAPPLSRGVVLGNDDGFDIQVPTEGRKIVEMGDELFLGSLLNIDNSRDRRKTTIFMSRESLQRVGGTNLGL